MSECDHWKPIGSIAQRLVAELKAKQRRVFERECQSDGVARNVSRETIQLETVTTQA